MGARQRAQVRMRKSKAGQNMNTSQWSQNQPGSSTKIHTFDAHDRQRALLQDWQDFADSHWSNSQTGLYSMGQEARNTERHGMVWGSTRLRDRGIAFVSAGNLVREEMVVNEKEKDNKQEGPNETSVTLLSPNAEQREPTKTVEPAVAVDNEELRFTPPTDIPTVTVARHNPSPRRDSVSSQSSEEIIFCGRQNPTPNATSNVNLASTHSLTPGPLSPIATSQTSESVPRATSQRSTSSEAPKHTRAPPRQRARGRRGKPRTRDQDRDEEEEIMNDYIAHLAVEDDTCDDGDNENSQEIGRNSEHYRFFDGSAEANVKVQTKPPDDYIPKVEHYDQAIDWDSADLDDLDDLSTTDEEVVEVSQVLRHRTRPSGSQYLVVAAGQGASDARWVLEKKLQSISAVEEIRIFQALRTMRIQETLEESDSESEPDEAFDDLIVDIGSEDDENARILKYTSRMTDEQIARALAKQEELGLGGDELVLFDGRVDDDDDDDEFEAEDDYIPFSTKKHLSSRGKSNRNRRGGESFPPAEAFADALEQDPYGAFDIMDFDRPSLRPKKKGRRSDFPFDLELEDEELAEHLRSVWMKDREKKAARKRERLEKREAALLEAADRSNPVVIKAEIRQFLTDETDELKLAPMDSATRASVHRLAKSLKLHSHSEGREGHGIGRYPVLKKTPRTPRYTVDTVWEIDSLMSTKKFFPKQGGGSYRGANATRKAGATKTRRGDGGGGAISGAAYVNGEIVGASAPEIGADNKGRAMLEKMGWTSGMGIGAVGNKGGLEAIKHVVKTTRAGLG
ncbi:uncharacterized protein Z518_10149 [Rhinocladiella mackenziei CBS 650.93]|uniref:G-patch domain-containing protein n=1 Tax=Rhinocladiella mackenziei CBS 650.93 TaxID=1442369 RepID=A0A0D2GS11_9EURO|nr:uncharacterized protein Z518_10149 [Rhinocladiella mackenziei CBS 650.93]KIX01083.1 hypothetical protein Z518_10149 [Rhinocladiella mackenziei CBS 650.93]